MTPLVAFGISLFVPRA